MDCIEKICYMDIEDKKYLSIHMMKDIRILDYAIEMVNNNMGNGILYIDKRQLNDDISFLYDVTNYIPFKEYINDPKVDGNSLLSLFNNLVNIILSLPDFLINIDNVVFNENYLMVDKIKKTVGIIYVPSDKKIQNTENEFKQFIKKVIVDYMSNKDNMEYFINDILPIVNSHDYSLNSIAKALSSSKAKNLTNKLEEEDLEKEEVIVDADESKKHEGFFSSLFKHKGNKKKKDKPNEYSIVFNINGKEEEAKIDKDEFILGRLKGSVDFVLASNVIGKVHAKIIKKKDEIYITDLTSKNGTYVNGKKLIGNETSLIKEGDEIKLGNVKGNIKVIK